MDHFKVFGSIAYALNQSQNRDKFDEKGHKYVFVGYSDESKGYWLLNPTTNQLVISRDVVFDEMEEWQWTLETTKASITYDFIEPLTTPNEVPLQYSQQASASTGSPSSSSLNPEDYDSDSPPRKVRSLREIYESCDVAFFACEP